MERLEFQTDNAPQLKTEPEPVMTFKKFYPGKFLKAADLNGDTTFTMESLALESVGQGDSTEEKPVLRFASQEQGLVLNITNANTIAELYGEDETAWFGQPITLYSARVPFGNKIVDAIRVKAPNSPVNAPPTEDVEAATDKLRKALERDCGADTVFQCDTLVWWLSSEKIQHLVDVAKTPNGFGIVRAGWKAMKEMMPETEWLEAAERQKSAAEISDAF